MLYPHQILNSRVVHLPSAALPAAGAYSSQAAFTLPPGAGYVSVYVTYARGAAGGYPTIKAMLGTSNEEGAVAIMDPTVTAAAPAETQPIGPGVLAMLPPADGSPVTLVFTVDVRGGGSKFRVLVAEAGVTATPGTCAVALSVGS